ncbi:NAD(P)-dependent oxidoreductase [Commensalibacter nepenthis]|uniref:NAD(P)-dependent oxidoreductase n=1 Tax=Commensalibacter nepenthis TaxID=3043872 RepID=A0ABT6QAY3_9PROT|nr:NAD(P)-dependent oxidoreductase [Commensalibacter sp. TBRC 10068]MDI2112747.1 NAD(P)-dependent oxidoreductase [Commensalibacter sp. TBRC 10068]MDI2113969.1 NAD(P)-dependent oxidoreductase [Commensalibacter sp. TBRC 10068]MDI2113970.1 NAD(P)-dependent oxidoreductase [Commensalibacter sp. TBRC 10068]
MPNLKLICQTGPVGKHIDLDVCKKLNITILEGGGDPTSAAELTWLLIMAANRKLYESIESMKNGLWQTVTGRQIKDKRIGILGFGKIGKLVAKYASSFDTEVVVCGSEGAKQESLLNGYKFLSSRDEFFRTCDIISVHLRLSNNTRESITFNDLSKMKENAIFVNTSRSQLLEKNSIQKLLKINKSIAFVLDVFDDEPVYHSNLLFSKNILCTPHIGYVTQENLENYFNCAIENLLQYCKPLHS